MPRSTKEILAHADELARKFEEYEPRPGDRERVPPEVRLSGQSARERYAEK